MAKPKLLISSSQCSLHNAPIFRLLLKVAVNGTHQCESLNFCGTLVPTDYYYYYYCCYADSKGYALVLLRLSSLLLLSKLLPLALDVAALAAAAHGLKLKGFATRPETQKKPKCNQA